MPVTVGLLAGLSVADVAPALYNAVGVSLAGLAFAVGGQRQASAAVAAENVARKQGFPAGIQRDCAALFMGVGSVLPNTLGGGELLRIDDLQVWN